jgi:hypothetical protein
MHEYTAEAAALEPSKPQTVRKRWLRFGILGLVAAVLLAAIGWLINYRLTYHTFAWWKIPPAIQFCGREYDRGSTLTALPTQDWVFTQVTTIEPGGWAVYSKKPRITGNTGAATSIPGLPCTMGLVVKQSDNQFVQYGLSGAP